jgi:uncharacterized protein (UPF0276 family)
VKHSAQTGVGLRPVHNAKFLEEDSPKTVGWVEVITENFLPWKNGLQGKSLSTLEKVRSRYDVSLHGVSLNLGSADPLDVNYLMVWKYLVHRIDPVRVSDHLCWTGISDRNSHDLLPLPYTEESLNHVAEKISRVQEYLGRKILIENVSAYVKWNDSHLSEAEYLSALVARTGCDLLLDLNNVFVTATNQGADPFQFIRSLPVNSIGQIHLAGPSEHEDGYLVDTHDSDVRDEVWTLYREFLAIEVEPTPSMIERDGNIPEWDVLELEVQRLTNERVIHAKRRGLSAAH